MRRLILSLASLILFALAAGSCGPATTQTTPQAANTPALMRSATLPPALAVLFATKLEHQPGMGAPQGFGDAIALGEDVLVVGAPAWNGMPGKMKGTVFAYRRDGNNWVEQAQLSSSDQEDGFQYDQRFGMGVALEGDLLFVGAPYADDPKAGDNTGAVYVFQNGPDGWQEIDRLIAEPPVANARFGYRLAVSGDTLLVGEDYEGTHLYIFNREGKSWRQQANLEISQVDGFTSSVVSLAFYGDTIAVSVQFRKGEEEQTILSSRVFIYERLDTRWEQDSILSFGEDTADGLRVSAFAVSLDGSQGRAERLAVGTGGSQSGFGSGAVEIYERGPSGWDQRATLTAPDGKASDMFGVSIALEGNLLLVGAGSVSEDSFWDGTAYVFEYYQGRWFDQLRLTPPEDGGFGDFFGSHVALRGDTYLVSAPNEFGNAVYVYEIGVRP